MRKSINKRAVSRVSFVIAFLLAIFVFSNIFFSALLFIFGVSVGYVQPALAIVATIVAAVLFLRRSGVVKYVAVLGSVALLIASSLFLTSITTDDTVDGPAYHEPAVGAMSYGWNPVYESVGTFHDSGKSPVNLPGGSYEKWVNHYPKAHWIYGANMYHVTGNMEMGRSMAILVIYILFLVALSYLLVRFKPAIAALVAGLVALNPISIAQMFSYYNDGLMGNLLFILILLFTMMLDKKYSHYKLARYILLGMVLAIIVNIKFTGILYAGVYSLMYFAFIVINKQMRPDWWKVAVTGSIALIIGLFVIGLSVYPKNYVEQGSPLYPLIGAKNTSDIITENQPASFENMNNLKKLFIANFSQTSNISAESGEEPQLKAPFTFSQKELPFLTYVDPRIAGYGVWFSGILLLSVGILAYYFVRIIRQKKWSYFWLVALPLIPTGILLLVMSDAWWARYFPQMYLLPIIALLIVLTEKKVIVANILIFTLLFNIALSLSIQIPAHVSNVEYRNSELKAIDDLTENGKHTPKVYVNGYGGYAYRYYDRYGSIEILDSKVNSGEGESITLSKHMVVYR